MNLNDQDGIDRIAAIGHRIRVGKPLTRTAPLLPGEDYQGLRRTPFTVVVDINSTPRARKPLPKVSTKRARQNRERAAMADRLWPDRREGTVMCSVPWCTDRADDLNERLPRARGGSIADEDNCHPVCRKHNQELTEEPEWGYRLGFLVHSWDRPPTGGEAA